MDYQINTYQQLSVFIEAILNEYRKKGGKYFTSDPTKIHTEFYKLKQKYPDIFKRLHFDSNGHYPVSKDLDSIFRDFEISGAVDKDNPTFKKIIVNINHSLTSRRRKRIPDIPINKIKEIAEELNV